MELFEEDFNHEKRLVEMVYVLKCDHPDFKTVFYVGYTTNINKRLYEHHIGRGAYFTNKYKPYALDSLVTAPEGK